MLFFFCFDKHVYSVLCETPSETASVKILSKLSDSANKNCKSFKEIQNKMRK